MLARRLSDFKRTLKSQENLRRSSEMATINALAYAIEARDPYTRGHSERVAAYSVWVGQSLGLSQKRLSVLRFCCKLHDIGKICISDNILLKRGKLTLAQRAQIEQHPLYGAEILGDLEPVRPGLSVILQHHERYDGKGYPYGLKKEETSIEARVVALTDAFDAMTSARPYRAALPLHRVVDEIKENSGSQFDPRIAKLFLRLVECSNPSAFRQNGTESHSIK